MTNIFLNSHPFYYILIIIVSLFLVLITIPSIIHVSNVRHLFDGVDKNRQKSHKHGISRLGGVAIFCSFTVSALLFSRIAAFPELKYLVVSSIVLFAVGLKDDLAGVNPSTKFIMQFVVAIIMVLFADVRLTSFYGVFNMHETLPYWASVTLTVLIIMLLINAFNLIDGVDGLAGTTGVIVNTMFGMMFVMMGRFEPACLAFAIVGATIGFLRFNLTPAKIFMGDTGSLLLGLVSVILAIKFIELNKFTPENNDPNFYSAPSIAVAVLIGPIFDSIRVFVIRLWKKGSPFVADNNHIHHRLLKLGLNHLQTTAVLGFFNIFIVVLALMLRDIGNFALISLIFALCCLFNVVLTYIIHFRSKGQLSSAI